VVSSSGLTRQFVGCAHGEKPTFSEKGIWPQPVIFISSARTWPLLMFAQDGSQPSTNKAVKGLITSAPQLRFTAIYIQFDTSLYTCDIPTISV
jgi:hypothetical protein